MKKNINVQNGTYKKLSKEVGIIAAVNSDSKIDVTLYVSERDKYMFEFNSWSKKTAQSTLEMCRVVYEAKQGLGSQDFLKFCNEIGRKGNDATVRKYLKIGEKYDQFYQYAELLPNSWTSIYEITQLPSDVFEALVATENSMANMTGDQLKQLMGKQTEDKLKSSAASAAAPTTLAPQTAQNSTEATENAEDTQSQSDMFVVAAASSDAIQNDSSESVSESAEAASDDTSSVSDHEFAQQATSTMLERVTAAASTHVEIEAEEDFEPYEIAIRFNSKPSDVAVAALAESVFSIKNKFRLDIEIITQKDHVM